MASTTKQSDDITTAPINNDNGTRKLSIDSVAQDAKKKKNPAISALNFLYNPKKKTVLGRGSLNWAKLAAFYTVFYFFLGCFFVGLVYVFASVLDRTRPRYYNTESTMAVRSPTAVVGLGFRPQPLYDSSLIPISNDPTQQKRIASSLRLFRDIFLLQNSDAQTEECSSQNPASQLPPGAACSFNWFDIVKNQEHPCSDNNLYGFREERPCVLVKLNKVYGWSPIPGALPVHIQKLRGIHSNKSVANSDVYITCGGTHVADNDVITDVTYYSLAHPSGSSKYGVIPNYYFPYRNARGHVQPFVLVQFNKLPLYQLVTITCNAWAPGIENSVRGMRGMVSFQLYRTHKNITMDDSSEEYE